MKKEKWIFMHQLKSFLWYNELHANTTPESWSIVITFTFTGMSLIYKDGAKGYSNVQEKSHGIRVCRLCIDEEIIRCFHFFNAKRIYGTDERDPH